MTVTVHFSDDQAAALKAKAAAEGLSLERWVQGLAEKETGLAPQVLPPIAQFIVASMRDVPAEVMATMPADGASQHDHYIYGLPKRDV